MMTFGKFGRYSLEKCIIVWHSFVLFSKIARKKIPTYFSKPFILQIGSTYQVQFSKFFKAVCGNTSVVCVVCIVLSIQIGNIFSFTLELSSK